MSIYFTSDQHYYHKRAMEFGSRTQFNDVFEMNEAIRTAHNRRVTPQDTVYYLGDLSFGKHHETLDMLQRLNGKKHWIIGNHDTQRGLTKEPQIRECFENVAMLAELKFGDQDVTLCHYAMLTWHKAHHGAWMLHGHSHGNCNYPTPNNRIMDVGVDTRPDFAPWSMSEIEAIMKAKSFQPVDHHVEKTE